MKPKGFLKIIKELNYPPIFLIPPKQFEMIEGEEKKHDNTIGDGSDADAISAVYFPVISVREDAGGRTLDNLIYHEIAHHLWPWREHWWIECFAEKMAGGGGRGFYSEKHNKSPDDLPSREALLKMARRQTEKIKKRYYLRRTSKRSHPEEWTPPQI